MIIPNNQYNKYFMSEWVAFGFYLIVIILNLAWMAIVFEWHDKKVVG